MVGRSVNQQFSTSAFLVAVLFFSKHKNHYILENNFIYIIDWGISLMFSQYLEYSPTRQLFFYLIFFFPVRQWTWNGNIFDDRQLLPLISPSTIIIIAVYSKVWGGLVRSRSEYFQYWVRFYEDHATDLCHKLLGWFHVYAGSTWYISDE